MFILATVLICRLQLAIGVHFISSQMILQVKLSQSLTFCSILLCHSCFCWLCLFLLRCVTLPACNVISNQRFC